MKFNLFIIITLTLIGCDGFKSKQLAEEEQRKADSLKLESYYKAAKNFLTIDPDSSVYYGNLMLQLSKGKPKWLAKANLSIGNGYLSRRTPLKESMDYLGKAVLYAEEANDSVTKAMALVNMGSFYNLTQDYPKALDIYLKSWQMFSTSHDSENNAALLGNIGAIYFNLKDYPNALIYLDTASKLNILINCTSAYAENTVHLSETYCELSNFSLAVEKNRLASKIAIDLNEKDKYLYTEIRYGRLISLCPAEVLIKQNIMPKDKFKMALKITQDALEMAEADEKADNLLSVIRDAYLVKSEIYEREKKCQLALEAYKKYASLTDTIFNKTIAETIRYNQGKYDEKEKQLTEKCISDQQAIITKIQNDKKINFEFVLILVGLVFAAIVIIISLKFLLAKKFNISPGFVIFLTHLWVISVSELANLKIHSAVVETTNHMPTKSLLVLIPVALYFSLLDHRVEAWIRGKIFKEKKLI